MLGLGNSITSYNVSEEPLFDLASNSNLKIWFKFNTGITESSGVVSQWDDSSGNSNHGVQTTVSNRPTTTDGYLVFDGSDDQLDLTSNRDDDAFTGIVAIDLTAGVTTNEGVFGKDNGAWALKLYRGTNASKVGLRVNGNSPVHADLTMSGGAIGTDLLLITSTYDGTTFEFRKNGVSQGTKDFTTGGTGFRMEQLGFGTSGDTNLPLNANIYEFAWYDSVLTGSDLTDAENAIMARVGIS